MKCIISFVYHLHTLYDFLCQPLTFIYKIDHHVFDLDNHHPSLGELLEELSMLSQSQKQHNRDYKKH